METDDLNQLIRSLNANAEQPNEKAEPLELLPVEDETQTAQPFISAPELAATEEITSRLSLYLTEVVQRGATDLLLVPGAPATIRVNGELVPLNDDPLSTEDAATHVVPFLTPERKRRFLETGSIDLAIAHARGRFRINLHRTRRGFGAAFRLLPRTIPSVAEL